VNGTTLSTLTIATEVGRQELLDQECEAFLLSERPPNDRCKFALSYCVAVNVMEQELDLFFISICSAYKDTQNTMHGIEGRVALYIELSLSLRTLVCIMTPSLCDVCYLYRQTHIKVPGKKDSNWPC
jgi:hypothetical protein